MEDTGGQSRPQGKVMTPRHMQINVWRYFGFYTVDVKMTNKDEAVCRLCKKQLSYSAATTNLRTYPLAYHPHEAVETEAPQASGAAGATLHVQPELTAFSSAPSEGPLPAASKDAITDKITTFVCKDMRPIGIVSGEGFRDLMMELQPRHIIPSWTTISTQSTTV